MDVSMRQSEKCTVDNRLTEVSKGEKGMCVYARKTTWARLVYYATSLALFEEVVVKMSKFATHFNVTLVMII